MSNIEKTPSRYEQHDSLSTDQNVEAVKLYKDYISAQQRHFRGRNSRRYEPTYTDAFFAPIDGALEITNLHSTMRRAKKHYRQHEHAYHAQAIKDAEQAGIDIEFSGDVAKNVDYSNEE